MSDKSNVRLVWSDDPKDKVGEKKKEPVVLDQNFTAVFRLEKGGRGGKTVTVIDQLPKHETYLKELCSELKSKCGTGGKIDSSLGLIEIQGDKRVQIKSIFEKKGIRYKGM